MTAGEKRLSQDSLKRRRESQRQDRLTKAGSIQCWCGQLNRVKLTDSVRDRGSEMLQKQETSPDSLSSAALPSRAASARESTLGMHAELRGVVYLTPPTSQLSTSSNLSKPALPPGFCPSNVTAGGWRCVRWGVSVYVSLRPWVHLCVCVDACTNAYVWVNMSLLQLSAKSLKEVSCHLSFVGVNSALPFITWRVQVTSCNLNSGGRDPISKLWDLVCWFDWFPHMATHKVPPRHQEL